MDCLCTKLNKLKKISMLTPYYNLVTYINRFCTDLNSGPFNPLNFIIYKLITNFKNSLIKYLSVSCYPKNKLT